MKRPVLSQKCRRINPVFLAQTFAVVWLFMDRFGAAMWGYGVFWTIALFCFGGLFMDMNQTEEREPVWKEPKK